MTDFTPQNEPDGLIAASEHGSDTKRSGLRVAYADPPYPGQSKRHYADHADYAGEVDHAALIEQLRGYPDGWALSTSSTALREVWNLCPEARLGVWTKGFAAFKNQRITFAWEPVLYVARAGVAENVGSFVRDWVSAMPPIFTGKNLDGTRGQKPDEFSFWLFDLLGLRPGDELVDLFPGSGAVGLAFERWCRQPRIEAVSRDPHPGCRNDSAMGRDDGRAGRGRAR